ncbi:hypothetical protein DICA1_E13080 [Diutina catenulata]
MSNVCVLNLEYSFVNQPAAPAQWSSATGLWRDVGGMTFLDNLAPLYAAARELESADGSVVVAEPQLNHPLTTVAINGSPEYVAHARMMMLRGYNAVTAKSVAISQDEYARVGPEFTAKLDELCAHHHIEASITQVADDEWGINVFGFEDAVTAAETQVRILVDCLINEWIVEAVDIDLSIIPLVGGVDLFNFNQIATQANANIYVPDLLPNVFGTTAQSFKIWITAPSVPEVILTREIVAKLVAQHTSGARLIQKQVMMTRSRLDMLTLYHQSQLFAIMFKYGVYVMIPPLGGDCRVVVQGYSTHAVADAMNEVNVLATSFYSASVRSFAPVNEYGLVQLMRGKKTCVVVANSCGFDVEGSCDDVKQLLKDMVAFGMDSYSYVRVRIELASHQREFITGKKNGKLIKILNQLHQAPTIKFTPYNGSNFYVDFEISDEVGLPTLVKGLELVEMEMPAEEQFNVPEVFHKSIIGNGGAIIQSIMKRHNVFVKFSSTGPDDYPRDVYSFRRARNVLVKCPRKNAGSIGQVKAEINELVRQCSTGTHYHTETVKLLRSHYLLLVNHSKLRAIHDLESQFSVYIDFPNSLEAFEGPEKTVAIKGSELKVKQCVRAFGQLVAKNYAFTLAGAPQTWAAHFGGYNREFLSRIAIPFKVLLGIEVLVSTTPIHGDPGDHQIVLSYYDDFVIAQAVEDLTTYLREKSFSILEKKQFAYDAKRRPRHHKPLKTAPVLKPTNSLLKPSQVNIYSPFGATMPVRQPIW